MFFFHTIFSVLHLNRQVWPAQCIRRKYVPA